MPPAVALVEKQFKLNKAAKNCIKTVFSPVSLTTTVFLTAIVAVTLSIIGTDITLAGYRSIPLSITTAQRFNHAGSESESPEKSPRQIAEALIIKKLLTDDIDIAANPNQWITIPMRVTAYCACRKCCGKFADGITASGHKIRRRDVFVAADKKIPFGTEFIIPGYNSSRPVKVMDRGKVIKGNRLDVYFRSHRQAKKWGTKILHVKLRTRG